MPTFQECMDKGEAVLNLQTNHLEDAVKWFQKAIETDGNKPIPWIRLGEVALLRGRYASAISYLDRALSMEPKHAYALACKGEALWHQGFDDNALTCFDSALEINSDEILALQGKGKVLLVRNKKFETTKYLGQSFGSNQLAVGQSVSIQYDLIISSHNIVPIITTITVKAVDEYDLRWNFGKDEDLVKCIKPRKKGLLFGISVPGEGICDWAVIQAKLYRDIVGIDNGIKLRPGSMPDNCRAAMRLALDYVIGTNSNYDGVPISEGHRIFFAEVMASSDEYMREVEALSYVRKALELLVSKEKISGPLVEYMQCGNDAINRKQYRGLCNKDKKTSDPISTYDNATPADHYASAWKIIHDRTNRWSVLFSTATPDLIQQLYFNGRSTKAQYGKETPRIPVIEQYGSDEIDPRVAAMPAPANTAKAAAQSPNSIATTSPVVKPPLAAALMPKISPATIAAQKLKLTFKAAAQSPNSIATTSPVVKPPLAAALMPKISPATIATQKLKPTVGSTSASSSSATASFATEAALRTRFSQSSAASAAAVGADSTSVSKSIAPTYAKALYDFSGREEGELSFSEGAIFKIIRRGNKEEGCENWSFVEFQGKQGWVPENFIELVMRKDDSLQTLGGHTNHVSSVALTSNGQRVVSGSWDNTLKVWDLASSRYVQTLQGHTQAVCSVALTSNGQRVVSGSWDNTLKVWDLASSRCVQTLEGHRATITSVALTEDGRCAVSGSNDKTLKVWDLASSQCVHTLEGHTEPVWSVALASGGQRVASGSSDKTLKVWDLASSRCVQTLKGHTATVTGVALTGDGRCVVSGSSDKTLKVWDLASSRCVQTLEGHTWGVASVALTSNGQRVVSGSLDKTLKVWDLASSRCVQTLEGHTSDVMSVALTNDGQRVVSGSWDNTLKVWDVSAYIPKQANVARAARSSLNKPALSSTSSAAAAAAAIMPIPANSVSTLKPAAMMLPPNPTPTPTPTASVLSFSTIARSSLSFTKKIGEGGFGTVYQGKWERVDVAIKTLKAKELSPTSLKEFSNEVFLMKRLIHPHVVTFFGVCLEPEEYFIVMEYCALGSLFSWLRREEAKDWTTRLRIALEIGIGLAYLHSQETLHRDLKSLNVLLDEHRKAKIADFGLSKVKTEIASTTKAASSTGTLMWIAPELFSFQVKHSEKSDVYAYGITLWEIAARQLPYENTGGNSELIRSGVTRGDREAIPSDTPYSMATLIGKCWSQRAEDRPSAAEAITLLEQSESNPATMSYRGNLFSQ